MYLDFRPVPVTDYKARFESDQDITYDDFSDDGIRISPIPPRRYYRNQLRKLGVEKVTAKIHRDDFWDVTLRTKLSENFVYMNKSDQENIPANESLKYHMHFVKDPKLNEMERALLPSYFTRKTPNEWVVSRYWDRYYHPVHDLQKEWIWKVQFWDKNNKRITSCRRFQILAAKYLKAILDYHTSCSRSYNIMQEFQSSSQGVEGSQIWQGIWNVPTETLANNLEARNIYADMSWDLEEDRISFDNVIEIEHEEQNEKIKRCLVLTSDYTEEKEFKPDPEVIAYFRNYLSPMKDELHNLDRFIISLRQNNFLEKGEFCPVRHHMKKMDFSVQDQKRADYRTCFLNVEIRRGVSVDGDAMDWIAKQCLVVREKPKHPLHKPSFDIEFQSPGYEKISAKTLQPRSTLTPETIKLQNIASNLTKDISKLILKHSFTKLQRKHDLQESLKALQNYVHPLLPRAWHNHKNEIEVCLEHCVYGNNHWNMDIYLQPAIWDERGVFEGNRKKTRAVQIGNILNKNGRKVRARVIASNILQNLDWPAPAYWMRETKLRLPVGLQRAARSLSLSRPEIWKDKSHYIQELHYGPLKALMMKYTEEFENALEEFVLSVNKDPEIAEIATQNIHLDYAKACNFLRANRELIPAVRRNPYLLQVCILGEDSESRCRGKHPFLWKEIRNLVSQDNERWNLQMTIILATELACVDYYGEPKPIDISARQWIEKQIEDNSPDLQNIPLAKLRKIVSGFPIHAPSIQTVCLNGINRYSFFVDEGFLLTTFYHTNMREVVKYALQELEIEQYPETPMEWNALHVFAWNVSKGYLLPAVFWKKAIHEIRDQDRPRPPTDPKDLPDMVRVLVNRYLPNVTGDMDPTFHETLNKKYLKPAGNYVLFVENAKQIAEQLEKSPYRKITPIRQIMDQHLQGLQDAIPKLQKATSMKTMRKTVERFMTQLPMMNHIESMCRHWPDGNVSWTPILVEPLTNSGYKVRELCNAEELRIHGLDMEHCIGAYMSNCLPSYENMHILAISKDDQDLVTLATIERKVDSLGTIRIALDQIQTSDGQDLNTDLREVVEVAVVNMDSAIITDEYDVQEAREQRREMREKINEVDSNTLTLRQELWKNLNQWRCLHIACNNIPDPGEIDDSMILALPDWEDIEDLEDEYPEGMNETDWEELSEDLDPV